MSTDPKLSICKYFQKNGCNRKKCKLLHITVDEEAEYNKTGVLPEHQGDPKKSKRKVLCNNFLNGKCDDGSQCKYMHIPDEEFQMAQNAVPESIKTERPKLNICKYFQENGCGRLKCKFLHITVDEVTEYNKTGVLPMYEGHPENSKHHFKGKVLCNNFLNGKCDYGSQCRFRHITDQEFQMEKNAVPENITETERAKLNICKKFQKNVCGKNKCNYLHITVDEEAEYNKTGVLPMYQGHPENSKRNFNSKVLCNNFLNGKCDYGSQCRFMHISDQEFQMEQNAVAIQTMSPMGAYGMLGKRRHDDYGITDSSTPYIEHIEIPNQNITGIQAQVLDLGQMNATLHDQNTQYRAKLQRLSSWPWIQENT